MTLREERELILSEMAAIEEYFSEFYNINLHEEIFQEFLKKVFSKKKVYTGEGYEPEGFVPRAAGKALEWFSRGKHKATLSNDDVLANKYAKEVSRRDDKGVKMSRKEYQAKVSKHVDEKIKSKEGQDDLQKLQQYAKASEDAIAAKEKFDTAKSDADTARSAYNDTHNTLKKQGKNSAEYKIGIGAAAEKSSEADATRDSARKDYQKASTDAKLARSGLAHLLG